MSDGKRVLLLEFVNADQRPGRVSATLPFVAGDYAGRGVPLRWLRFAVSTTNLFENGCDHVTLERRESRKLREAVSRLKPTILLCTDRISPPERRALLALSPGMSIEESFPSQKMEILPLLDRAGFWPRYDWEPGNPAAERQELDNIHLNFIEECGYRRCTFCSAGSQDAQPGPTPGPWIVKQLQAIARSRRKTGRPPHAVLLGSLPSPEVLDLCLDGIEQDGMQGVQLLLAVRPSKVPSVTRLLRRRFAASPGSRSRVGVYSCGIESFDAGDLALYRKGTKPLDSLRAVNELRALAGEFPERFSYEGLSFLLFTPWTTLESLALNYGVMRRIGMLESGNNRFQCRLRLHPALPLTARAAREGLLVEEEPDPVVVMNRRKLFSAELPWRFRDPRVRPISRVVLRYDLLATPLADELAGAILRRLRAADPGWRRGDDALLLDFTLAAVAAARASPAPLDEEALLDAALSRCARARASGADPETLDTGSWREAERAELARGAEWARRQGLDEPAGGVILVEFAALERFTLSLEFPFICAWLRSRGIPVTWIRFALDASVRYASREEGIALGEEDLRALRELTRGSQARHVLFSFQPAASLWKSFQSEHPQACARYLRAGAPPPQKQGARGALPIEPGDVPLRLWLGIKAKSDAPSYMKAEPDFGFTPGNPAAKQMPPLAFMMAGAECVYRKSVAGNPAYEGVDLSGCRTQGCAFCTSGGTASRGSSPAVAEALSQIQAFYRTYPFSAGGPRPRLRMSGQKLLREVAEAADAVAGLGVPPSDLLFDGRMDYLLRLKSRLEAAARRLEGTGHKVHICLVGLENFSASELQRMNKGITAAQSLAAIRMLRRIEREHPESFGFEEHGGLSTIFFTPWTRLDDLALNFSLVRHFGLERLCGKILTSRARLYEGLPMTALARRDGLLIKSYEDDALDTARRNFYPDELPWRFAHPEVEAIGRIATRMLPSPALEGDALYARVQRWAAANKAAGLSETQAVLGLIAGALARPRAASPDELMAPEPPPRRALKPAAGKPPPDPEEQLRSMLALHRAGLTKVSRWEGLEESTAERFGAWLREQRSAVEVLSRRRSPGAPRTWEVFFGPRSGDVSEAARLTDLQYSAPPAEELADAKRRIGALYGYPACCARSFAALSCASANMNEWVLLLRRCESPGPIDPLLNPFRGIINYVPCSTQCKATLVRARAILKAPGRRDRNDTTAARARPYLFLLDRIGDFVELIPQGPVGRTFDFLPGAMNTEDPALRALVGGGTILIDEGMITVHRGGVRVATLAMRAAVWWHKKAFDPDFWRQCAVEIVERRALPSPQPARQAPAPPAPEAPAPVSGPSAALTALVRSALSGPDGGLLRLGGFDVASVEPGLGLYVVVRLERRSMPPAEALIVHVEPLKGAQRYYKAAGGLAFGYCDTTPLRSSAQAEAFAALMARLAKLPGNMTA